eukprot:374641_1
MSSSEDEFANGCSSAENILSIIHTIICVCLSLVVLYASFRFIVIKIEMWKILKICTVNVFVVTLITLALLIPIASSKCYNISYDIHEILELIFIVCYSAQTYLVAILFWFKIKKIFLGTQFALSESVVYIYSVSFIIFPTLILISLIYGTYSSLTHIIVESAVGFQLNALLISLVTLFIYKMIRIYNIYVIPCAKIDENNDTNLIHAITKIFILTLFVILTTSVHTISYYILYSVNKNIYNYIELMDIFVNFTCVTLCSPGFKIYYHKGCCCIHTLCSACCTKMVSKMSLNSDVKIAEMIVVTSQSKKKNIEKEKGIEIKVKIHSNRTDVHSEIITKVNRI